MAGSSMKRHDKTHFFKYVTFSGLRHITSRLSRKWSSPRTFNDPFDAQSDFGFPFTFEEFGEAFLNAQEEMVFGDLEPHGDPNHPLFQMIMQARLARQKATREKFRSFFRPTIDEAIPNLNHAQQIASKDWDAYLARLRILCLSEINDDLLMWAHYADHHKGAVIRLDCSQERESVLLAALPVNYTDRTPYIGTMQEWIRHLTGQEEIDYDLLFTKLVTTKSTHWSYEKEWRVVNESKNRDDGLHMYDSFWPEEIEAVYFGCRANDLEIEEVIHSMHSDLGHVELFKARQKKWQFGLEFNKIK